MAVAAERQRGPWWPVLLVAVLLLLAAALPAQSPPFSTAINLATTPRLGYIAGTQGGNPTLLMQPCCWCEQDLYAWTLPGTASLLPNFGWHPSVGHQIVIATEGYRCQPFPAFQPFFPVGSYVPLLGVSFPNPGLNRWLPGGAPFWSVLHLDPASETYLVPPYVVVDYGPQAYQRWLATIDVPGDPVLAGTELWMQAFRDDPYVGGVFASRAIAMILR